MEYLILAKRLIIIILTYILIFFAKLVKHHFNTVIGQSGAASLPIKCILPYVKVSNILNHDEHCALTQFQHEPTFLAVFGPPACVNSLLRVSATWLSPAILKLADPTSGLDLRMVKR